MHENPAITPSVPLPTTEAELKPDIQIGGMCVLVTRALDDVVAYLQVDGLPPGVLRNTARMLVQLSGQLMLRADVAEERQQQQQPS